MNLRMFLPVVDANVSSWQAMHDVLYFRDIDTGWLPQPDIDKVILWSYAQDEPGDGPSWDVHGRQMDTKGGWSIDLKTMIVNPTPDVASSLRADMHLARQFEVFYPARHLTSQLFRAGWYEYGHELDLYSVVNPATGKPWPLWAGDLPQEPDPHCICGMPWTDDDFGCTRMRQRW